MFVRKSIGNVHRTIHVGVQDNPTRIAHEQSAMFPERAFFGLFSILFR